VIKGTRTLNDFLENRKIKPLYLGGIDGKIITKGKKKLEVWKQ